jgi:hypothetical protein
LICYLIGHLKMAVKVRGGVMSIDGSNNVTTFETDMRDTLRARKPRLPDVARETGTDYSALVTGISAQSVHEIDHLVARLQGLRQKLTGDSDRLYHEIIQHAGLSQSVLELTKIVSDGMASVDKSGGV